MDNSLAIGLATQKLLRDRMDVTANNLANLNTTGFKVESIVARELNERPAEAMERPGDVSFAEGWQLQRDMSAGTLTRTGNPLDVAIDGEGFFSVAVGEDTFYTRDGRLTLDAEGRLITRAGHPVMVDRFGLDSPYLLSEDREILIDEAAGPITVTKTGEILQNNQPIAKLDIVAFDTPQALEKRGNGLYAKTDEEPREPQGLRVEQGYLESSNVQAIREITNMIEVSRAYTSVAKAITEQNNLREQAITKLAKLR